MADTNSKLDKIEGKVDKLDSRLDNLELISAKQQVILEEHQRRSLSNEETIDIVRQEVKDRHDLVMIQLNPVLKIADRLEFLIKVGIGIGGFFAFILTLIEIKKALL